MTREPSALALEVETVAELRELYRAAEARAARIRLTSASGRQLALADGATVDAVVQDCARRLAWFLGFRDAQLHHGPDGAGLPIVAPGHAERAIATVVIGELGALDDITDAEDREACRLQLEMIGATLDRIARARELSRLLGALAEREARLEFVVGRLFTAQEEERRRVSHDLHDGVAQIATALARMLEGSSADAPRDLPAAERRRLAAIARDLVGELRAVIGGLRPTILDDLGLEAGLQALADSLAGEGYRVAVTIESAAGSWPAALETALFRVAQEALANVRKHAGGPCAVEIALHAGPGEEQPRLCIADSGRGPAPGGGAAASSTSYGIAVMRERMAAVGGRLDWTAGPHGGVSVVAQFPREDVP